MIVEVVVFALGFMWVVLSEVVLVVEIPVSIIH